MNILALRDFTPFTPLLLLVRCSRIFALAPGTGAIQSGGDRGRCSRP
jgi:hypothetical protein